MRHFSAMTYRVELKDQTRRDVAVVCFRATASDMGRHMGTALGTVYEHLVRAGVKSQGLAVAIYRSTGVEAQFDVRVGFVVPSAIRGDGHVVPAELPECEAAVVLHVGPYDRLHFAYDAIRSWMAETGYEPTELMWEEYFSPPPTPPAKMRTQVVWPVRPRASARTAA